MPVDRIGKRPFDPNFTFASTTGRWSDARSSLRWLETLKCRRQRKGMRINVVLSSNIAKSRGLIESISFQINPESSSVGCSNELVDRIGTRLFDTDVAILSQHETAQCCLKLVIS